MCPACGHKSGLRDKFIFFKFSAQFSFQKIESFHKPLLCPHSGHILFLSQVVWYQCCRQYKSGGANIPSLSIDCLFLFVLFSKPLNSGDTVHSEITQWFLCINLTIFEWNSQVQSTVIVSKDICIGDTRIIFIHSLNSQSNT